MSIIGLYKHHGTREQFHSEFKTDLDLERLPSGKFDTNDAIVHLASFADNFLRPLGTTGTDGRDCTAAASNQAQTVEDGVAGDHVSGGEVCGACAKTDSGLRARGGGARARVHCLSGQIVAHGFSMRLSAHPTATQQYSGTPEGVATPGSTKMT